MAEIGSNSHIKSPEDNFDFVMDESTHIPIYESLIPNEITQSILLREKLPDPFPDLDSSTVEDFIIKKIETGIISPDTIAQLFVDEGCLEKTKEVIKQTKAKSEKINWIDVFTIEDAKHAQLNVLKEMEAFGMTSAQVKEVAEIQLEIGEGIGATLLTNEKVYASRLQAVRKAADYVTIFGNRVPFEQIVKCLLKATIAHELGHKINDIVGGAINNIPVDLSWMKGGDSSENRAERFAEYWAGVGVSDNSTAQQVKNKEWLIHLGKVNQLWNTISRYSKLHEQKVDLSAIFTAIHEKVDSTDEEVLALINARRGFYFGNEVESYATPYSREVIQKSVNSQSL